jgi:hypothetical protein
MIPLHTTCITSLSVYLIPLMLMFHHLNTNYSNLNHLIAVIVTIRRPTHVVAILNSSQTEWPQRRHVRHTPLRLPIYYGLALGI